MFDQPLYTGGVKLKVIRPSPRVATRSVGALGVVMYRNALVLVTVPGRRDRDVHRACGRLRRGVDGDETAVELDNIESLSVPNSTEVIPVSPEPLISTSRPPSRVSTVGSTVVMTGASAGVTGAAGVSATGEATAGVGGAAPAAALPSPMAAAAAGKRHCYQAHERARSH